MAIEQQHHAFYEEILKGKSYIDTRLSIQTCVSHFIANTFFGGDYKRVVYTNTENAFRKRVEALANGIEGDIFLNTLQLPFCNFFLSSTPEIIKTAAASVWQGYYDEDLGHKIHFFHMKQNCTVNFFFERSDDVTTAFEIAQAEHLAEAPIRYVQDVLWRNKTLGYPIWITVKDVKAGNESFNETDWLKQNHMYAMQLSLEIETPHIVIHRGLKAQQLPFKWKVTGDPDKWNGENGEILYYAQKCILTWAESALDVDCSLPEKKNTMTDEDNQTLEAFANVQLKDCDDRTLKSIQSVLPNNATAQMVEGFFKDPVKIGFNLLKYNPEKTTIDEKGEVSAYFDFVVKPSTYPYWDSTELYIPSRSDKIFIKNCKDKFVIADQLHPNSEYTAYFICRDISGNFNTIPIEFRTPAWEKEKLPDIKEDDNGKVVLQAPKKEAPVKIKAKGLIGLEF